MVNGRSSMCDRLKSVRQWSPRWCHDEINISHRHCSGPALSGSVSYGPLVWSYDKIEKKNVFRVFGIPWLFVGDIFRESSFSLEEKNWATHDTYIYLRMPLYSPFLLNTRIFDTRMFNKSRHVRHSNELCVAVGMLYFMSQ